MEDIIHFVVDLNPLDFNLCCRCRWLLGSIAWHTGAAVLQNTYNCRLCKLGNLLARILGDAVDLLAKAHINTQLARKELLDIGKVCRTSRKHHAIRQLGHTLCTSQLTQNKASNILQALLDNLRDVALQNLLAGTTTAHHLHTYGCVARNTIREHRTARLLNLIDLRNLQKVVEIGVNRRCTDRERCKILYSITTHDNYIGEFTTQIDYRNTVLALLLRKQHRRQVHRVYNHLRTLDTRTVESSFDTVLLLTADKHHEIYGREFTTETTTRIFGLTHSVYTIAQWVAGENDILIPCNNPLHTHLEFVHIVISDTTLPVLDKDTLLVLHAVDISSRDTHISRVYTTTKLILECLLTTVDSIAEFVDIIDTAIFDSVADTLHIDTENLQSATWQTCCSSHHHIR